MDEIELGRILWDYHRMETPLEQADIILGLGNRPKNLARNDLSNKRSPLPVP